MLMALLCQLLSISPTRKYAIVEAYDVHACFVRGKES
jgi:hypothetical protein